MAAVLEHLEIALIILAVSSFVVWLIQDTIRTKRKNSIPVETDRAIAYYKHPEVEKTTLRTLHGYRNEVTYWITFHTDHGEAVKLHMTELDFFRIQENAVGMLTWQGDKFWKFESEKKED